MKSETACTSSNVVIQIYSVFFIKHGSQFKGGTINRIIDLLIDKFHQNDYHYRFANNRSFDFCVCYFTVFTLTIQALNSLPYFI